MSGALPPLRGTLARSRLLLCAILVISALLVAVSAVAFQAPELLSLKKSLIDFDAFHIAGTMAAKGQAADTYQSVRMLAAEQAIDRESTLMPWTYPPPYMLAMAGLAQFPVGLAYVLFTVGSFLFYLHVLRRIAGDYLPGVLIAITPALIVLLRTGQNGFITGGLIGTFLLAFQKGRKTAGIPLGLMVIKPHLAAGIALLALLGRRWAVMAIAAAIVIAAMALSTLAFGIGIWPAFLGGVAEASDFLAQRFYPLFRMSSIYACVRSLGGSAGLAMALHGVIAVGGIGVLWRAWQRGYEPRRIAAVACLVSLLVSPYNYDYDLTILGLAIAFVLRDLVMLARSYELFGLFALSWAITGYGLAITAWRASDSKVETIAAGNWSFIAPGLLLLTAAAFAILRRGDGGAGAELRQ